jgi:hypothetical protein
MKVSRWEHHRTKWWITRGHLVNFAKEKFMKGYGCCCSFCGIPVRDRCCFLGKQVTQGPEIHCSDVLEEWWSSLAVHRATKRWCSLNTSHLGGCSFSVRECLHDQQRRTGSRAKFETHKNPPIGMLICMNYRSLAGPQCNFESITHL